MANRADRRRMMREKIGKSESLLREYSQAERIERLMQQGISQVDLENQYREGYEAGFREAGMEILTACYAACALGLHEAYRFGQTRLIRAINAMDEHVATMITSGDLKQEVMDRLGLEIDFTEGVNRVGPKAKGDGK